MFRLTKTLIIISLLASLCLPALPVWAAGASISLSANKSTVANGGSVIVGIYMNGGGTPINAVQVDLIYPAGKLQYVGFSATGSAFEIAAASGGGDGTATISRGTLSPVAGSGLVGTVTFKALSGSGSAAISVAGSSSLVSDGTAVAYGSSGASVSFGAAASGGGSSSASAAPAPPKDTAAPQITAIKTKDVTPFSATILWTTNEPADSAIEYGLDANYGLSASVSQPTTEHAVTLNSAFLTPLTTLHYRIKTTDGAGNVTVSPDQKLQLPGVPVTIVVRGPDGEPKAGVIVTLDGQTGTTDKNGRVVLASSLGNKKITTSYQGVTIQKPITVEKAAKPLPPVELSLAREPLNGWMLTSVGLMLVVLTLLAVDAVLFGSKLFAKFAGIRIRKPKLDLALGHAATVSSQHKMSQLHPAYQPKSKPVTPSLSEATLAAPAGPQVDKAEPKPVSKPEIASLKPDQPEPDFAAGEPPVDITRSVAELMGEPALDPTPKVEKPAAPAPATKTINITHFGSAPATSSQPIKIELEPLPTAKSETAVVPSPKPVSAPPIKPSPASVQPKTAKAAKKPAPKTAAKAKPKKTTKVSKAKA